MRKGETIVIPRGTPYWWPRTADEIEHLRDLDAKNGTILDSAGEPKIYAGMNSARVETDVVVVVTRTKNVTWNHWVTRPRNLVECLMPIGNSARIVCVRAE